MANLDSWAPEIDPSIPGVPIPAVKRAVRSAAIEFCKETLLWTLDLTRINVVGNTQSYTLTVPAGQYGQIVLIDDVKYKADGADDDQFRTLTPIVEAPENLQSGYWKYTTATEPQYFDVEEGANTTLVLVPIPTESSTSGLLVKVCLKPTITADTVPDFLYNQHLMTIAAGALAYLFNATGMPWHNPNEARANYLAFRREINSAKWRKITGATKRPLQVKMRRFV